MMKNNKLSIRLVTRSIAILAMCFTLSACRSTGDQSTTESSDQTITEISNKHYSDTIAESNLRLETYRHLIAPNFHESDVEIGISKGKSTIVQIVTNYSISKELSLEIAQFYQDLKDSEKIEDYHLYARESDWDDEEMQIVVMVILDDSEEQSNLDSETQ